MPCPHEGRLGPKHELPDQEPLRRIIADAYSNYRRKHMSVIAKMNVVDAPAFNDGQKAILNCVCDDKLMAMYHPENENVVFTKASPWGEATLQLEAPLQWGTREEVYLIFQKREDKPNLDGAVLWSKARVVSLTDFGGTSKQTEICSAYRDYYGAKPAEGELSSFNLKMSIDNPGASHQFKPGEAGWWLTIYRASTMTMDEALALAHSFADETA